MIELLPAQTVIRIPPTASTLEFWHSTTALLSSVVVKAYGPLVDWEGEGALVVNACGGRVDQGHRSVLEPVVAAGGILAPLSHSQTGVTPGPPLYIQGGSSGLDSSLGSKSGNGSSGMSSHVALSMRVLFLEFDLLALKFTTSDGNGMVAPH